MKQQTTTETERLEKNAESFIVNLIGFPIFMVAMFLPILLLKNRFDPLILTLACGFGEMLQFYVFLKKRKMIISKTENIRVNTTAAEEIRGAISLPIIIKGIKFGAKGMLFVFILWAVAIAMIKILEKIFVGLLMGPKSFFFIGMMILTVALYVISSHFYFRKKKKMKK
jgi:hypothetical protein